jgi:CheY-like chemotaxis protein
MWAPTEVLILEDDPDQLGALKRLVAGARLEPVAAAGPRQALSMLEGRRPLLAIIDLDMSRAPDAERRASVYDVLRRLHQRHPNCIPLVYSARVETIDDQARAYLAHPHALFQSKRHGEGSLVERVNGLLGARVGDLAIRGGAVEHVPSGNTTTHRVAVSLLAARRANRSVVLRDSDARAARRFEAWLAEHSSALRVRALGNRHYQLAPRESAGPP